MIYYIFCSNMGPWAHMGPYGPMGPWEKSLPLRGQDPPQGRNPYQKMDIHIFRKGIYSEIVKTDSKLGAQSYWQRFSGAFFLSNLAKSGTLPFKGTAGTLEFSVVEEGNRDSRIGGRHAQSDSNSSYV